QVCQVLLGAAASPGILLTSGDNGIALPFYKNLASRQNRGAICLETANAGELVCVLVSPDINMNWYSELHNTN
ncbi:MAG TPA: hypothetical protein VGG64_23515, partial [Pirellulales bacterium]